MSEMTSAKSAELVWQRLWFTLREQNWTSMAVLGTTDAQSVEMVARTLAEVGIRDEKISVGVISALGMSFSDAAAVAARVEERASQAELVIITSDSPGTNPAMIPVLGAVNAVVLVVRLGESSLDAVRRLADGVGRDKILATVTIG